MQDLSEATPTDMDVHILLSDISFSNAEIGAYQVLLTMARQLQRKDIAGLLEDTLEHEEDDLQKMLDLLPGLVEISPENSPRRRNRLPHTDRRTTIDTPISFCYSNYRFGV